MPLRVYINGRPSSALDALRRRLLAESNLELVDRLEAADAVLSLPRHRAGDAGSAADDAPIETLTTREHEVLELVANGLPNRDIAHALAISEHTVKFHLASIFGKLGAATRTEAVQRGLRLGLIEI